MFVSFDSHTLWLYASRLGAATVTWQRSVFIRCLRPAVNIGVGEGPRVRNDVDCALPLRETGIPGPSYSLV